MPLGTGTFQPSGGYVVPRAYLKGFALRFDPGAEITQTENVWDGYNNAAHSLYFRITMRPTFFTWSSNRYTMNHVIIDNYTQTPPSNPNKVPFNFTLAFIWRPGFGWYLRFAPGGLGTVTHWFTLPPAPLGYWKPSL